MGRVADQRVGFEASDVLSDTSTAEPDFHLLFFDHHLDSLANIQVWSTISNSIDINKAVGTDATLQAASADGQRTCRQGPQGQALIWLRKRTEKLERDLGRAEAHVADLQRELAEPGVYEDNDKVQDLVRRHDAAKDAAAGLMDAWMAASEELERAERRQA